MKCFLSVDGEDDGAGGTDIDKKKKKDPKTKTTQVSYKEASTHENDSAMLAVLISICAIVFLVCCFAVIIVCRKLRRKQKSTKPAVVSETMGKISASGFTGQVDIEPKLSVASFARQRMISNSSVISSLSQLLLSDGPRQKEFTGKT